MPFQLLIYAVKISFLECFDLCWLSPLQPSGRPLPRLSDCARLRVSQRSSAGIMWKFSSSTTAKTKCSPVGLTPSLLNVRGEKSGRLERWRGGLTGEPSVPTGAIFCIYCNLLSYNISFSPLDNATALMTSKGEYFIGSATDFQVVFISAKF